MVVSLDFVRGDVLYSRQVKVYLQAAQFSPHGYRPRKNTRNAKQTEYKSIWYQEYTVNFLDRVLKVKLYESKEKELCVSFGSPFQCSTQIIVYAKNSRGITYSHFSDINVLIQRFIGIRYKKQKVVLNKDLI